MVCVCVLALESAESSVCLLPLFWQRLAALPTLLAFEDSPSSARMRLSCRGFRLSPPSSTLE